MDYDKDSYHDQWTGRGYYKSSAQNAMRVARTETNIAYRRADRERWSKLDFVLGFRIQLSRQHPQEDICDDLVGDYPKTFKFDGWHPQCFCFATPILASEDEIAKMNEAFARGEDYTPQGRQITDYPDTFKGWVRDNADKIAEARARGTEPYFLRNNRADVDKILNPEAEVQPLENVENALRQQRIEHFSEMLLTYDWEMSDMNQWMEMSIDDRIEALRKSGISGMVPLEFFDPDSMYTDIYKPVERDSLLGYIDEVLTNAANGFDMEDMDSYLAFYSDGRMVSTRGDDYELEGVRKLPRKGLIALMTNGGLLDNRYWVKDEKGLAALLKYTDLKVVENGEIKGLAKGRNLRMAASGHTIAGVSGMSSKEQNHLANSIRDLSKKVNLFENLTDVCFSDNPEDNVLMSWQDGTLTISKVKFELNDGVVFCPADELKQAVSKLMKGETLTFNEEYAIEALYHENVHSKAAKIFPKTKGKFEVKEGSVDEVIAEACTQLYARENYPNVLKKYGVDAANYEAIKYNGYGYKETCDLLREFFTKDGKIQVGELINIANETTSGTRILEKKLRAAGWSQNKIDDLFDELRVYIK